MKTTYQTEIHLFNGKNGYSARITRRQQDPIRYKEKDYTPTPASQKRLEKVCSAWINDGRAKIDLLGRSVFVELID